VLKRLIFRRVGEKLMRQAASKKMQGLRHFRFIPLFFLIKKVEQKKSRRFRCGGCTLFRFSSAEIAVVKISAIEHFRLNVMQGGMNCPG
jgi:hypothetical protein